MLLATVVLEVVMLDLTVVLVALVPLVGPVEFPVVVFDLTVVLVLLAALTPVPC